MKEFNINERMEYQYLPGMEIAFTTPDLYGHDKGTVRKAKWTTLELNDGTEINKGLVHAILNVEDEATG